MLGILLVDKPIGITSHDVVNAVRRKFGTKRVGHAGTLDPLASGVLVLAVGPATRFLQYLPLEPKCYLAQIRFGASTETFDREGTPVNLRPVPTDLMERLDEVKPNFSGLITQLPPMYSSVKVNGQPLYRYARKGETVARDPRSVHVTTLEVTQLESDLVEARIVCSGGTYIRTLANDIGEAIGCGAHLHSLVRLKVGRFELPECHPLDSVSPSNLIPLSEALPPMPLIPLDSTQTRHLREGRSVKVECVPGNHLVGLLDPFGEVFSVARLLGSVLQPECVIPESMVTDAI